MTATTPPATRSALSTPISWHSSDPERATSRGCQPRPCHRSKLTCHLSLRKTAIMLHAHAHTRRGFCLCCLASATFAATGGWLTPREAFAQARSIVDQMRTEAGQATITVHRLRGNVSVLEGSGGNIAVLTGS